MKKRLIMTGISVLLICVCLLGCTDNNNPSDNSNDNNKYSILGTWTGETIKSEKLVNQNVTYFSDGIFTNDIFGNGTYEIKNNTIVIFYEKTGKNISYDYSFSNDGDTLTLTITGSESFEVLTRISD